MTWEDVKTMGRLCVPTSIQSIMPALSSAVMITFVNPFGLTALTFLASHIWACVLAFVLLQISDKKFLKPVKNT